MATNPRIYYAIAALGFAQEGTTILTTGYRAAHGVQSVSFNTNFNIEPILELGQISNYDQKEGLPAIELTATKVIDGRSLLGHLASPLATTATLAGRFNTAKCMGAVAYYDIAQTFATGTPLSFVVLSGLYLSQWSFGMPVNGNMTESCTFVGNNKQYYIPASGQVWTPATWFNGNDSPLTASGGVQRRQNVLMGATSGSYIPSDIPGSSGLLVGGLQYYVNPVLANGQFGAHVQDVQVAANLGRTDLLELGRKGAYFRYMNIPVEVTCSISITATEYGDTVDAFEDRDNTADEAIRWYTTQGVIIDLGRKNRLTSVNTTGGDTGGGNVTITYSYRNDNDLTVVFQAADPANLTLP